MADLPEASISIDNQGGAQAGSTDLIAVFACVSQNADVTPRLFSSTRALLTKHLYAQGVDYCAHHFQEVNKPVLFVGLPIVTAGALGSKDASGNTGTSVVSVAAAGGGILDETSGVVGVLNGGVVGTDQIMLSVSLDGGRTKKNVRLGTATSYTIPYVGLALTVKPGTLVAGDTVLTWETSAPRWDQAGIQAGREALATQQKQVRSFLVIGDCATSDDASDVLTEANSYASANDRFVFARVQAKDRKRAAKLSRVRAVMTGAPSLTFAEVGASGDTITRATGSWISDGFAAGDVITVSGSASNNVTGPIASLSATVITLGTTDLAAETTALATVVASNPLTFAEVGATDDTITRTVGSWLNDGFAVGDVVTITGTASNNVTGPIKALSATVLTFDTTDLVAEVIGSYGVSITTVEQTTTDAVAGNDARFSSIDAQPRIDIGHGRGRKMSRIVGYRFRRPVQWAASLREYQHDVQIPTYRKADRPCDGWDLQDADGITVEHDETNDGGALAARFTCFRTYANGPEGAFIALSLTRDEDNTVLSRTHNMAVVNVGLSIVQTTTEDAIGQVVRLNPDGTGTDASLSVLDEKVNSALKVGLLQHRPEGARASSASWKASRTDVIKDPGSILGGVFDIGLDGTIEQIRTVTRVNPPA